MNLDMKDLFQKIYDGDRAALAQGITLVESDLEKDRPLAMELLRLSLQTERKAFRLGLSGPPGVGKSTFIEAIGQKLLESGDSLAVMAIDPSSRLSGGSILGDKSRMSELSKHSRAFVRPSPSRGELGGITVSLPGSLVLCEAAGFQWIVVETVGAGQSEVNVQTMVDHFTLLAQPGSGDELQGIKKGILEYVDSIVVHKADIDKKLSNNARSQLLAAVKVMRGVEIPVFAASSISGEGIDAFHEALLRWKQAGLNRMNQNQEWFRMLLEYRWNDWLQSDPNTKIIVSEIMNSVHQKKLLPFEAVEVFFQKVFAPRT